MALQQLTPPTEAQWAAADPILLPRGTTLWFAPVSPRRAGLQEELLCRLTLMPALYFGLRKLAMPARITAALAATGFAFAVWHALGEDTLSATYFVTRVVFPGCLMTVIWLASPAAIVVGHSTAHLLIPALFVAPPS